MAKLTKLYVENFKRIQAVEIEPEGNVTIVGGMNEQGKSSLLDSISVLLQGKAAKIPEPVRQGTKKAKITGEILKDEWDAFEDLFITRTITSAGNWYLKVQDRNGKTYKSPEGMLKKIFGEPVDPSEFVRMVPAERVETLKQITGLDFTKLDTERKELYDERTLVGREVKQMDGYVSGTEVYPDAPGSEVSVAELMEELERRQGLNMENDKKKDVLETIAEEVNSAKQRIDDMNEELKKLQAKINEAVKFYNNLSDDYFSMQEEIESLIYADEQEIKDQISSADNTNHQVQANITYQQEIDRLAQKQKEQKALTQKIDKIDTDKQNQLANIEFPIPGLSFNEDEVLYNNLPFNAKQLSSEELLRVSFAIAIAARPNLKNILIREGSLLDDNNLKLVSKMAEGAGIHVFIETVGDDADRATLIIENGMIKTEPEADEFADI